MMIKTGDVEILELFNAEIASKRLREEDGHASRYRNEVLGEFFDGEEAEGEQE